MIKLIHTSDFHIGVPTVGLRGRDVKNLRKHDIFKAIEEIFKFGIREKVHIIIISGDIFHSPNPNPQDLLELDSLFKLVEEYGIHIVAVAGNHDKRKVRGEKGYLSIYKRRGGQYIHYEDTISEKPLILDINGIKVGFVLLPFVSGRFVRARTGMQYAKEYQNIINKIIIKQLGKLKQADYKILVAHLTVRGADLGPKISYVAYDDPPVHISSLCPSEFDYIALGHLHVPQKVHENVFYAGSVERIDFSEETLEKSFIFAEIGGTLKVKNIKLSPRKMITIDVHLSPLTSPLQQIVSKVSSVDVVNALVRIRVYGNAEVINKLYSEAYKLDSYLLENFSVAAYKVEAYYTADFTHHSTGIYREEVNIYEALEEYIKRRYRGKKKEVIERAIELGRGLLEI